MADKPREGDVWDYPYLWVREAERGETEGRKSRPSAVVVSVRRVDGLQGLALLAIATQPPGKGRCALPVPDTERRRANLSEDLALWIMLDEHNIDTYETSYFLVPEARIGAFSQRFLMEVQHQFLTALRERKSRKVRRDG